MQSKPPWKRNKLPPMVNVMQIASGKYWRTRAVSHKPAFMGSCLTVSRMCLPFVKSKYVGPCVSCVILLLKELRVLKNH